MTEQFNGATAKPSMTDDKALIDEISARIGNDGAVSVMVSVTTLTAIRCRLQALTQGDVVVVPKTLEAVAHAALRFRAADNYVHPVLSRQQAIDEGYGELNDAIEKYHIWQPAAQQPAGEIEG